MKNQNDLIFSIVSIVIGIVLVVVFYATSPSVAQPPAPTPVSTDAPQLPKGDVVFANSLPGGNNQAGGFGAGIGGMGMGPMGMAGRGRAGGAAVGSMGALGGGGGGMRSPMAAGVQKGG